MSGVSIMLVGCGFANPYQKEVLVFEIFMRLTKLD